MSGEPVIAATPAAATSVGALADVTGSELAAMKANIDELQREVAELKASLAKLARELGVAS